MKTVVIAGAGFTGLPIAHKLLRYTLPKIADGLKVILISPNTHFYWNLAAVRGVIPGAIPDEQLFYPIAPAFEQYPSDAFEFVLGKAEALDHEKNEIHVALAEEGSRSIQYDHLVIATGSSIHTGLPFKCVGSYEDTLSALHSLQAEIEKAQSIVIAGSGPTGVETAGELAAAFGDKKNITLVSAEKSVLMKSEPIQSVVGTVERDLKKLGVTVIHNTRVESTERTPDSKKTKIKLSNGQELHADCYLPLFGVRVNSSWIPNTFLDDSGSVKLDNYMRVEGTQNIWGIGDIGNREAKQVTATDTQIIDLAAALDLILTGRENEIKEHGLPDKQMIFITLGKRYATGQIGSWRLWGWIVAYVKGRKIFVDTAANYVGGKQLRHAAM